MTIVLLLTLVSFVVLYWFPSKGRNRKSGRLSSLPPIRMVSGNNPFAQFTLTQRERSHRVGFLS